MSHLYAVACRMCHTHHSDLRPCPQLLRALAPLDRRGPVVVNGQKSKAVKA
jgi:hypothetical protein